jgi:hypothetical protein
LRHNIKSYLPVQTCDQDQPYTQALLRYAHCYSLPLLKAAAVTAVTGQVCLGLNIEELSLALAKLPPSLVHLAMPYGGRQDARLEPKYIQGVFGKVMQGQDLLQKTVKRML